MVYRLFGDCRYRFGPYKMPSGSKIKVKDALPFFLHALGELTQQAGYDSQKMLKGWDGNPQSSTFTFKRNWWSVAKADGSLG